MRHEWPLVEMGQVYSSLTERDYCMWIYQVLGYWFHSELYTAARRVQCVKRRQSVLVVVDVLMWMSSTVLPAYVSAVAQSSFLVLRPVHSQFIQCSLSRLLVSRRRWYHVCVWRVSVMVSNYYERLTPTSVYYTCYNLTRRLIGTVENRRTRKIRPYIMLILHYWVVCVSLFVWQQIRRPNHFPHVRAQIYQTWGMWITQW